MINRIYGVLCRYYFLYRNSWPRIIEIAYWPTMQMLVWGLVSTYLVNMNTDAGAGLFFAMLGGALMWEIFLRAQIGHAFLFLEEMWSRNLGHLFISPLRPYEWIISLIILGLIRTTIGILPPMLLAIPIYGFSIFEIGFPFLLFFINLFITGWWLGLIVQSLILRYGLGIEALAWTIAAALAPISCVFYPVSVLPEWLQTVAFSLPTAYCFEALREVLLSGNILWDYLGYATLLNILYGFLSVLLFMFFFKKAKDNASLVQMGE